LFFFALFDLGGRQTPGKRGVRNGNLRSVTDVKNLRSYSEKSREESMGGRDKILDYSCYYDEQLDMTTRTNKTVTTTAATTIVTTKEERRTVRELDGFRNSKTTRIRERGCMMRSRRSHRSFCVFGLCVFFLFALLLTVGVSLLARLLLPFMLLGSRRTRGDAGFVRKDRDVMFKSISSGLHFERLLNVEAGLA